MWFVQSIVLTEFSVGTLFAPFVRLEVLRWDPLVEPSVKAMKWHSELLNYGVRKGMKTDLDDEDMNLVPNIIEKVILPKVVKVLTHLWNPRSQVQVRYSVDLRKFN